MEAKVSARLPESSRSLPDHHSDRIIATSVPRLDLQNSDREEKIKMTKATSLKAEIGKSSSMGDIKHSKKTIIQCQIPPLFTLLLGCLGCQV